MKKRLLVGWIFGLVVGSAWLAGADTLYVDVNGTNNVPPFSSWERATPEIQFAVDAAEDGDTVLVNSGTYHLVIPVTTTNAITIQSVHGAASTIVDGGGNTRCFDLSFSACNLVGFTIVNGEAANGGGAYCYGSSATIDFCVFSNNTATGLFDPRVPGKGGGMYYGTARYCTFVGNTAPWGGGMYAGTAQCCKFIGNSSGMESVSAQGCAIAGSADTGMIGCHATNCTVTGNSGTGISDSWVYNCIAWYNGDGDLSGGSADYCCSPDVTHGTDGNITNAPLLATSSHLAAGSLCIGAGNVAYLSGTDIDSESWSNPPSIGCDEYSAGSGGDILLHLAPVEKMAAGASATVRCAVVGKCSLVTISFGDGTTVSNQLEVSHAWNASGTYAMVLSAYNADHLAGVSTTQSVEVVGATQYVSTTGDDANDGWSWGSAKRTIRAAVDESGTGGTVLVADGTYFPTSSIALPKPLAVRSANGPVATIVDGGNSHSCFSVQAGKASSISGFTIRNGYSDDNGGGISGTDASMVSNCFFVENTALGSGAGLSGGRAVNCAFAFNQAEEFGGGIYNGRADHCTFTFNTAASGGAAAYGTASNSIAYFNTASLSNDLFMASPAYCCFPGATNGVPGNTTNAPLLASSSHLSAGSPCIGAGTNSNSSVSDIDGEAWGTPPSIGCDEFHAGTAGAVALYLRLPERPVKGEPATVRCAVFGAVSLFTLDFGDGTVVSNQFEATHIWNDTGSNSVVLTAYNADHPAGVSKGWNVEVLDQVIHVSPTGNDTDDGLDWANAKRTIQSGVDAARDGYTVLLTNGTYHPSQEIVVATAIAIQGLDEQEVVVDGGGTRRCFNLGSAACSLRDLTIRKGKDSQKGGGVFCSNNIPEMVGCTFSENHSDSYGGGLYNGAASNCTFISNYARYGGGLYNGTASNCTFISNSTETYGGGQYDGAAVDCDFSNNTSAYGGAKHQGTATNCRFTANSAQYGGALSDGAATGCLFSGNSATSDGGGQHNGVADHCIFVGNHAAHFGGGMKSGSATNSVFANNSAEAEGGGIYGVAVNNCTIVGNSVWLSGGGVKYGTLRNCIVWYNTVAGKESDMTESSCYFGCSPDAPAGNGNITNAPQLFTTSHIGSGSPCIGKGNASYVSGTDIDGESWNTPPSMGCDEFNAGTAGPLRLFVSVPSNVAVDVAIPIRLVVLGAADRFAVDFGDGNAVTNQLWDIAHTWNATGEYDVVLTAFNADFPSGIATTQRVSVVEAVRYVSTSGEDAADGLSWGAAKQTIQAAINAAPYGGTVRIADGTYFPASEIVVSKNLSVQGTNGTTAVVDGGGSHRCFNLGEEPCLLSNLTIANGCQYNAEGGGIYCASSAPVVSNCFLSGNSAPNSGGGAMFRGAAIACTFSGNSAFNGGALEHSSAERCIFDGNSANGGGSINSGNARNCLFINNHGGWGGAMEWATAYSCTFVSNSATAYGTAIMYSTAYNSIFWDNYGNNPNPISDVDYSTAINCRADSVQDGVNGNTTNAPLFVDGANGDYHLQATSPCIDAGDNARVSCAFDLDGLPRIVGGTVDMGAYEYQVGAGAQDSDGDGMPDFWESLYFGNPTNAPAGGNPDSDPFSNLDEYIADTDPTDSNDWLRIVAISNGLPETVYFDSSGNRLYTLMGCADLVSNVWSNVSGNPPRAGIGGLDSMQSTNDLPAEFYKIEVQLP